ncbi:MHC class Ia alpha antigen [Pelobates cultripes]|uniref:MHC class Ia alpha antigen n=1 Tax=Pelobates cultripes TaxID=61616 RepID=A0AAD1T3D6_PELCU|nr:MHC class Ia alpha antigen [Pelobates cultripes]
MRTLVLLLFIVGVSRVNSGHSLQYFYTGISAPGHGLPEFSADAYLNGVMILKYNNKKGLEVPVPEWIKKEDSGYWERDRKISRDTEAAFKHHLKSIMSRYNHTQGLHYLQHAYGCVRRDDNSTRGYSEYAYDGKDFLELDIKRAVYVPVVLEAQLSAKTYNSPEVRAGERNKAYLEMECIKWLDKHIHYGKEEFERRVPPRVTISDERSDEMTKLHCLVFGFYPRDIDVNWKKNGIEAQLDEAKEVLPNTDGTYQIRVTVEVPAEEIESYSCHVDHISQQETFIKKWKPKPDSRAVYRAIGIIAAVIFSISVLGTFIWRKRSAQLTRNSSLLTSVNQT